MKEKIKKILSSAEKLQAILDYLQLNASQFSENLGIPAGTLYDIKRGQIKRLSPEILGMIARTYPCFSPQWLLTGEGEMLKEGAKSPQGDHARPETPNASPALPLIPFDAVAGLPSIDNIGVTFLDCDQYRVPDLIQRGAEFLIRVSGSSMYPKYSNGDILACHRITDILFFQWGKAYVLDTSQGVLVKRLQPSEKGDEYIRLVSDNKEHYAPFDIPKSDIRSISIVVGVIRFE